MADLAERSRVLERLRQAGVNAVFHYVPLHSSPAGRRFGRTVGRLSITENVSDRLIRLPLWVEMAEQEVEFVVASVRNALEG